MEDRDRIASEINDVVVRRLFTAGLALQRASGLLDGHRAGASIQDAIAELDQAIANLRDSVFGARATGLAGQRTAPMSGGTALSGHDQLDMAPVETAVAVLRNAGDKAVDELGSAVPGAQLRALPIIDGGGRLDLYQLAAELATSVSVTGRLCDRMTAAGLLVTGATANGSGGSVLVLTTSGHRLASWIRDRQRAALSEVLNSMRPRARQTLVHGLTDLAAGHQASS